MKVVGWPWGLEKTRQHCFSKGGFIWGLWLLLLLSHSYRRRCLRNYFSALWGKGEWSDKACLFKACPMDTLVTVHELIFPSNYCLIGGDMLYCVSAWGFNWDTLYRELYPTSVPAVTWRRCFQVQSRDHQQARNDWLNEWLNDWMISSV